MKLLKLAIVFSLFFVMVPVAIVCSTLHRVSETLCDACDAVLTMAKQILEA
jgi:hypothetical protein